jgi:hypothetical protein
VPICALLVFGRPIWNEFIYYIWWLTSDCGRSMTRWCIFVALQVIFFAILYAIVGVDYGRRAD